jgi:hypothetical protein
MIVRAIGTAHKSCCKKHPPIIDMSITMMRNGEFEAVYIPDVPNENVKFLFDLEFEVDIYIPTTKPKITPPYS